MFTKFDFDLHRVVTLNGFAQRNPLSAMTLQYVLIEAGYAAIEYIIALYLINFIRLNSITNFFLWKTNRQLFYLVCNCRLAI